LYTVQPHNITDDGDGFFIPLRPEAPYMGMHLLILKQDTNIHGYDSGHLATKTVQKKEEG
jgi:hypothetical protein